MLFQLSLSPLWLLCRQQGDKPQAFVLMKVIKQSTKHHKNQNHLFYCSPCIFYRSIRNMFYAFLFRIYDLHKTKPVAVMETTLRSTTTSDVKLLPEGEVILYRMNFLNTTWNIAVSSPGARLVERKLQVKLDYIIILKCVWLYTNCCLDEELLRVHMSVFMRHLAARRISTARLSRAFSRRWLTKGK